MILTTLFYRCKKWLQTHPKTSLAFAILLLSLIIISSTSAFFMPPMLAGLALIPKLGVVVASLISMSGPGAPFVFGLIVSGFSALSWAFGYAMYRLFKFCFNPYGTAYTPRGQILGEDLPLQRSLAETPTTIVSERSSTASSENGDAVVGALQAPPRSKSEPAKRVPPAVHQQPTTQKNPYEVSALISAGEGTTGNSPPLGVKPRSQTASLPKPELDNDNLDSETRADSHAFV